MNLTYIQFCVNVVRNLQAYSHFCILIIERKWLLENGESGVKQLLNAEQALYFRVLCSTLDSEAQVGFCLVSLASLS
jgi:hypothetical protein